MIIDRIGRTQSAQLLEAFLAGKIDYDELDSDWPRSEDAAIEAIGRELWNAFYSEFKPRSIEDRPETNAGERELVERSLAFLRSDHPYEWSDITSRGEQASRFKVDANLWPFFVRSTA